MTRKLLLALPILLGACAALPALQPVGESASLPRDAVIGAGDPTRAAALSVGTAFTTRSVLVGTPAQQARVIGNMEYLAVNTASPMLEAAPPTLRPQMRAARAEWRQALGIPAEAPAQQVIDQLYAAARALDSGMQPPISLAALEARPALPNTAAAAQTAALAVQQRDRTERAPR
ncbi:hypothetical protein ACI6QG_06850 [Roseococcus sp. DSY-14]|uniref:hypothetical protein n=1 Tax=Roseococcus sp. DSY-14 TaxID=3369650 RepID=UPI00387B68D8